MKLCDIVCMFIYMLMYVLYVLFDADFMCGVNVSVLSIQYRLFKDNFFVSAGILNDYSVHMQKQ